MKTKRKPSKSQLDPNIKEIAKKLKEAGVLSPRANLRKKAVSRHVVKKVKEYEWIIKNHYKAVKVKKELLDAAKSQGLHTVGSRIIVPRDGRSQKRLEQNIVTGVRSIPGGNLQIVSLPYPTMTEFLAALRSGEVDRFKNRNEQFAFTLFGNMSLTAFIDAKHLYEWLIKYDSITNPFTGGLLSDLDKQYQGFTLYRVLPGKWNPPSEERKRQLRKLRRISNEGRREAEHKKRKYKLVGDLSVDAAYRRRRQDAENKRKQRASWSDEKKARESERAKERVRRARAKKKQEKAE